MDFLPPELEDNKIMLSKVIVFVATCSIRDRKLAPTYQWRGRRKEPKRISDAIGNVSFLLFLEETWPKYEKMLITYFHKF